MELHRNVLLIAAMVSSISAWASMGGRAGHVNPTVVHALMRSHARHAATRCISTRVTALMTVLQDESPWVWALGVACARHVPRIASSARRQAFAVSVRTASIYIMGSAWWDVLL